MKKPLVSVYITNHNYEKYVQKAVESVLEQTMTDFEIIIVDDGSTDNSREIIEKFSDNAQIRIIFQKRKGLNITNNIAMRVASGKYIMRLDADDYLDPNALLVMSNVLENDDELGMVFPDYYLVDEKESIIAIEKRHDFSKDVTLLDMPAHGACTMIRRQFLMKLNGYDENYECQDGYELWIKFTNHFNVKNVNTPLFFYRQHGKNLTSNENKILSTRAKIKEDYLKKNNQKPSRSIAIIPIRDYKNSNKSLAFEKINGEYLLDIKIKTAIESKRIQQIIITSPEEEIRDHVKKQFGNIPKVFFIKRDVHLARLNVDLSATVEHILLTNKYLTQQPENLMILYVEYPFTTSAMIDDAINSLEIFGADSLVSVRSENSMFLQHGGNGMQIIPNQENFLRLERETIYRHAGGITLTKADYFLENKKLIGGKVGHIVVDQKASLGIFSALDLEVVKFLGSKL